MIIVTGRPGQTIYDIAIKYYGDCQGIKWIIKDNPEVDLAAVIEDQNIYIREDVMNRPIREHLKNTNLTTY